MSGRLKEQEGKVELRREINGEMRRDWERNGDEEIVLVDTSLSNSRSRSPHKFLSIRYCNGSHIKANLLACTISE